MNIHEASAQHPGRVLRSLFMRPLKIDVATLHFLSGLSSFSLSEIVAGKRAVDRRAAVALGTVFGTETEFWLELQPNYEDAQRAQRNKILHAGVTALLFSPQERASHPDIPAALRCQCCGRGCKTHHDHICPRSIAILFIDGETSTGLCEDCNANG